MDISRSAFTGRGPGGRVTGSTPNHTQSLRDQLINPSFRLNGEEKHILTGLRDQVYTCIRQGNLKECLDP